MKFLILLFIVIIFIARKFIGDAKENEIRRKIKERGGTIISIDEDKSYIKEADEIEPKNRYTVYSVYKAIYTLNEAQRIAYIITYSNFVSVGNKYKCDWVERLD